MKIVTCSVVLYNHNCNDLLNLIRYFTQLEIIHKFFIIDNSPECKFQYEDELNKIIYIHNPENPGFGAAHNIAINESINLKSDYHFVINPDVIIIQDIVKEMVLYMENNEDVAMIMPEVLNKDRSMQNLPKLLPTPFSILLRKLKQPKFYYNIFIQKYELRFVDRKKIYNSPILSGCFTLLRVDAVKEIGMYDNRFFMYFEDWDLSRRMHEKYKTIYYPLVSVIHGYESGANKNKKLFKIYIKSAVLYFNKWGWFFDKKRNRINKAALRQFQ